MVMYVVSNFLFCFETNIIVVMNHDVPEYNMYT